MNGDQTMRRSVGNLPAREFPNPAFVHPKPRRESKVAIVTSAALHTPDDSGFVFDDAGYRFIDRSRRDLILGHRSSTAIAGGVDWASVGAAIRDAGAKFPIWFYMMPGQR